MKRSLLVFAACAASSLVAGGCTYPATEVLVNVVSQGLRIGTDIDQVEIQISTPSASGPAVIQSDITYLLCTDVLTENCQYFPLEPALVPGPKEPGDSVRVEVDALLHSVPKITNAAVFKFEQGMSQRLDIVLYHNCLGQRDCAVMDDVCASDGTCQKAEPVALSTDSAVPVTPQFDLTTVATPDGAAPDLHPASLPDLTQQALPDLNAPDLSHSDLSPQALPDLNVSDLSHSDLANPDLEMPDMSVPDLNTADMSSTESKPDLAPIPDSAVTILTPDLFLPDHGLPDFFFPVGAMLEVTQLPPVPAMSNRVFQVKVTVQDAMGHTLGIDGLPITVLAEPSDVPVQQFNLSGTVTRTTVGGSVVFDDLSIDAPQNYVLLATAPGDLYGTTTLDVTSSWTQINDGLAIANINQLAAGESSLLYAAADTGLYYTDTTSLTMSWSRIDLGSAAGNLAAATAVLGVDGGEVIAAIVGSDIYFGAYGSFVPTFTFPDGRGYALAEDPVQPGVVVAVGTGLVAVSTEAGAGFTNSLSLPSVTFVAVAVDESENVFVAESDGTVLTSPIANPMWSPITATLPGVPQSMVTFGGRVFASTTSGVYELAVDQMSFSSLGFPGTGTINGQLNVDEKDQVLYFAYADPTAGGAYTYSGGTWTNLNAAQPLPVQTVVTSVDQGGTFEGIAGVPTAGAPRGVQALVGGQWQAQNVGLDAFSGGALAGNTGGNLFGIVGKQIYRWNSSARSWSITGPFTDARALQIDGGNALYAITGFNTLDFATSANLGGTWRPGGASPHTLVPPLAVGAGPAIYANSDDGLCLSLDDGANFSLVATGIVDPSTIQALAVGSDNELYLASTAGLIYSNDGATFNQGGAPGGVVSALTADPATASLLYASTSFGLYKTVNGGKSFGNTSLTQPTVGLTVDPTDPSILYAWVSADAVLRKSTDAGVTWARTSAGIGSPIIAVVVDESSHDSVYVLSARNGAYLSSKGGF